MFYMPQEAQHRFGDVYSYVSGAQTDPYKVIEWYAFIYRIPNSLPGRERGDVEVVGMEGIPLDDLIEHYKDNPAAIEQINLELSHSSALLLPQQSQVRFSSTPLLQNAATPTSMYAAPVIFPQAMAYSVPIFPPPPPIIGLSSLSIPQISSPTSIPVGLLPVGVSVSVPHASIPTQTSDSTGKISFSLNSSQSSSLKPFVQPPRHSTHIQPTNILLDTSKEETFVPSKSTGSDTLPVTGPNGSILMYSSNESPEEKRAYLGKYHYCPSSNY